MLDMLKGKSIEQKAAQERTVEAETGPACFTVFPRRLAAPPHPLVCKVSAW